jgi:hypothetical protein
LKWDGNFEASVHAAIAVPAALTESMTNAADTADEKNLQLGMSNILAPEKSFHNEEKSTNGSFGGKKWMKN